MGRGWETQRVLSEVECDEVWDGKWRRSETSMKGFNLRNGLTRGAGYREEVLVIEDEVGSVEGLGGKAQQSNFVFCVRI